MTLVSPDGSTALFSVDPGSSDKGSAVARCEFRAGAGVRLGIFKAPELAQVVCDVCAAAEKGVALLCLDAPIVAFGGIQAPSSLGPAGVGEGGHCWPFDVSPFSQRPCEHALTSKPTVVNTSLIAPDLAAAVGELCGWDEECRRSGNTLLDRIHPGVSVSGYMGAPHAPIVRVFLRTLAREAGSRGLRLTFRDDPGTCLQGSIAVYESHPAVAMAFYAGHGDVGFPPRIDVYKPSRRHTEVFEGLAQTVLARLAPLHGVRDLPPVTSDDELDALVGLLCLSELAAGEGDFFGTPRDGRFLVPRRPTGRSYGELWKDAADALDARQSGGGGCARC